MKPNDRKLADSRTITGNSLPAQNTVLVPLTDQGLIRVSGEDAPVFLHNLLTSDVKGLPAGVAGFSGLCTPKGRLLARFLLWRDKNEILLQLDAKLLPGVLAKLSMYVLRSKVKLTDLSNEKVMLGLCGTNAIAALHNILQEDISQSISSLMQETNRTNFSIVNFEHGQIICLDEQRFLLVIDLSVAPVIQSKLAACACPAELSTWHWFEVISGQPRISTATQEEFLPQMVNLDLLGGVSFNKGCYLGQEIIGRTQNFGTIKRRMYRAHVESFVPEPGNPVFSPETETQACGSVVLSAPSPQGGYEILVVVQTSCVHSGEVHLGSISGPRLQFQPLPYPIN